MGIARDILEIITKDFDPEFDPMGKVSQRNRTFSSIARRAAEGTLQFPLVVSKAIPFDTVQRIANASERNDASFAQIVLTMNPFLDTSKGDSIEYLRDFHQNMDTNDGLMDTMRDSLAESMKVELKVFRTSDQGLQILKEELAVYGSDYRAGTLNNVVAAKYVKDNTFVLPLTESQRAELLSKNLTAVLEKKNGVTAQATNIKDTTTTTINSRGNGGSRRRDPSLPEGGGGDGIVMRNILRDNDVKKSNELVPTLLHIRVIATDSTGKSDVNKYVDFVVGVKCMIHAIDSQEMIDNLVDACRNHDGIFKFIKWTTGEIDFLSDFLLNMKEYRKDVSNEANGASQWWNALKHRANLAKFKKSMFFRRQILPNASIAVTQEEVDYIKNTYGFDLMNPAFVDKIMKKFFLLCFIVADDALEVAHFKYEGQLDYQTISYAGLEKENSNSARQFKDILKAVQRV